MIDGRLESLDRGDGPVGNGHRSLFNPFLVCLLFHFGPLFCDRKQKHLDLTFPIHILPSAVLDPTSIFKQSSQHSPLFR
jgi:hypothetical protein